MDNGGRMGYYDIGSFPISHPLGPPRLRRSLFLSRAKNGCFLPNRITLRFGALLSASRQLRHVAPREVYFATYTPRQNMIKIICRLRAAKSATLLRNRKRRKRCFRRVGLFVDVVEDALAFFGKTEKLTRQTLDKGFIARLAQIGAERVVFLLL